MLGSSSVVPFQTSGAGVAQQTESSPNGTPTETNSLVPGGQDAPHVSSTGQIGTTGASAEASTSPSLTGSPNTSTGASAGAIAGAAVGCLIAGLLIGALAAFFVFRKKNRDRGIHTPTELTHITDIPGPKSLGPPPPASHDNDIQLSQFLLDATPDKEIAGELQSLGELVQQHVESNYHLHPVQASPQALAPVLQSLGLANLSGLAPEAIAALCIDPKTRQIGLRHVISVMIFGSTEFNSPSRFSMLPASVASLTHSMPPVEPRGGDAQATSLALSRWRSLTTFLLHPSRSQRLPLSPIEAEVAPQAQNLAAALNTYLHHFVPADQGRQHQQLDHLQLVILECTKLGYEILSQPSDWRFVYTADDAGAAGGRAVVVCPGLDKLTSKDGKAYRPPHRKAAPSVAQLAVSNY
ncbi:hypothetical protein CPLU01_04881 [Colletotrichum plurivorum]|uniref:Uncharacterized protein n=1 Tax=Colletotrichum plurivorum TaxID=2175906 RepID=A0A8H6KPK4_9PEZI|nr:hypothetical protein CPLU01_04881 [Colletotrichum plurivorum]